MKELLFCCCCCCEDPPKNIAASEAEDVEAAEDDAEAEDGEDDEDMVDSAGGISLPVLLPQSIPQPLLSSSRRCLLQMYTMITTNCSVSHNLTQRLHSADRTGYFDGN